MLNDPTYNMDEIRANPEWHIAWAISEGLNDNAPIGWSRYIPAVQALRCYFTIEPKPTDEGASER